MDDKIAIIFQFVAFSPKHLSIYHIIPRFSPWHWAGYFICSRKSGKKKNHVYEFTDTKQTTGCESFARLSENLWRHLFAALRFETIPVAIIFLTRALCLLKILWIRICRHLPLVTRKMLADFLALLLLHTMLNLWCGSPVKAIEKQRIGERQGPLFCRKWSKVWV